MSDKLHAKANENTWFEDLVLLLNSDGIYNQRLCNMTVSGSTLKWLVVMKRSMPNQSDPTAVQLKICSDRSYNFQVCNANKEIGTFSDETPSKNLTLKDTLDYLINTDYRLCPGIPDYSSFQEQIRFDSKRVRKWDNIERVDSDRCLLWHKPGKRLEAHKDMCDFCMSLLKNLKANLRRAQELTSPDKAMRATPSSNRALKFLSPASRKRRYERKDYERRRLKKLIRKMKTTDVELNDSQSDEMTEIVQNIESNHKSAFQGVLNDIGSHSDEKKELLQNIWDMDLCDRKKFSEDQIKNVTGFRGNRWNMITFRLALSVYIRSTAAYNALKSFPLLSLPSISTLRKFMKEKLHAAGECESFLADQRQRYEKKKENLKKQCKPCPDGFGALIFDEVKVMAGILWNSRNNAIIGYAMTPEELHSLHDIYFSFEKEGDKKSNYMLQFLWRDLCSNFDVMGPYYSTVTSMESKFLVACITDAMQKFHKYGFKTKVIICDGASTNLTALKGFLGQKGSFSYVSENGKISHSIDPSFYSPYTNENVYLMICPTHQLKNMISQLYASRPRGTKSFEKENIQFGWTAVQSVYQWNLEQAQLGNALPVPGLKLAYIVRDSWTRLNVRPAKIMQQQPMIAALKILADRTNNSLAKSSIVLTANFLEACNNLFEAGILSHKTVKKTDKTVLDNMQKGQQFFETWLTGLLSSSDSYNPSDSKQKMFLAWQTWDLMRLVYYGFSGVCEDFFKKYGDQFYISPLRLNGSAIETLFSQFKYLTGGKLSANNYATARAAYLMKVDLQGQNFGEKDYRNVELYLRQCELSSQ